MTIKEMEGHGKYDDKRRGDRISNFVQCRYRFPQFPINKTKFILGMSKELTVEETERRKKDLQKIKKYLIRQTLSEDSTIKPTMELTKFNNLKFLEFLYEVGMFSTDKKLEEYSNKEKKWAYERYIDALSASVRGSGSIFLKTSLQITSTGELWKSIRQTMMYR